MAFGAPSLAFSSGVCSQLWALTWAFQPLEHFKASISFLEATSKAAPAVCSITNTCAQGGTAANAWAGSAKQSTRMT